MLDILTAVLPDRPAGVIALYIILGGAVWFFSQEFNQDKKATLEATTGMGYLIKRWIVDS